MPSLHTSIGGLKLESPAMLASGILGISAEVFDRLHREGAGAIVSKSLSTEPWEGYHNPTFVGARGGGWLNAVGLSNPGAAGFAEIISGRCKAPVIASMVGSAEAEFEEMIRALDGAGVAGYEINLSCPHVAKVGLEVGDDPELVSRIVSAAKSATSRPVIAKVGLGTTHYIRTARAAADAGADAITAINTIRAMAIDVQTQRPVLSNKIGGLSGPPIRPVAVRCVYEASSELDIPVIGCGGISTWEDAAEFILAGACAVQVGSAIGDGWTGVFGQINSGLAQYMEENRLGSIGEMVGLAKRS